MFLLRWCSRAGPEHVRSIAGSPQPAASARAPAGSDAGRGYAGGSSGGATGDMRAPAGARPRAPAATFGSFGFVCTPAGDVGAYVAGYVDTLDAELRWKVRSVRAIARVLRAVAVPTRVALPLVEPHLATEARPAR